MTLGEWLDDAIAERATRLRVSPDRLDESQQVEAISARLGALLLDDLAPRAAPARVPGEPALRGRQPNMRLLDAAVAHLGLSAERPAPATPRPPSDEVVSVARRIAELEVALERRRASGRAAPLRQPVESRLRQIAESLLADDPDLRGADLRPIEGQLAPADDHHESPTDARGRHDLGALRRQIDDLSRAVVLIGERAGRSKLEPALLDLLSRIEASRAEGVSDAALAPITHALIDLRATLEQAPAATARALGDELAALHRRLDRLDRDDDGAALDAVRAQVETLARHLADLVVRLGGRESQNDSLHDQIAMLAARVKDLAATPRRLSDSLVSLVDELRHCIEHIDSSPGFRMLEQRIEDMAARQAPATSDMSRTLTDLRAAIDTLSEHPAVLGLQAQLAELAQVTVAMPRSLLAPLDDLRRAIESMAAHPALGAAAASSLPGPVGESLAEIRLSLARLASNAGVQLVEEHAQRLQSIERHVADLSEKLDAPPILERIAGLQDSVLARIDRLRSELPVEQISGLRSRLDDVHRAVSQPGLPPPGYLDDIASRLAVKLERVAAKNAHDPRALQAIENQVLRIAERLDRHGETSEAIATLERSIGALFTKVEGAQTAEPGLGATIARDLSSLREGQNETDRRTRATLEAVHETLEKVVDRLAMLESDVSGLRMAPAAAPEPPAQAPEPPAPVRQDVSLDMSLEMSEPRAAQQSFIAAARRATRLMGGAPPPPARVEPVDPAARSAEIAETGERSAFADTSRKVMLGVAGLALTVGAYQTFRGETLSFLPRATPQETAAQSAASPAAPSDATPDLAAALDPTPVGTLARTEPAVTLLRELATSGHPAAQFELAARLIEGRGVGRDAAQAVRWLEKAAQQKFAPAQYRLAALYEKGAGVERSTQNAMRWYADAAEAGHVRAMHNLGVMLADGVDNKPDYVAAAAMFRRAAEHGLRDSQYNLAVLYVRGLGVEDNLVEAYKFFALAGAQGDADALTRRDEVAARLAPRQMTDARRALETFALRTPEAGANEPPPFDVIVSHARASLASEAPVAPVSRAKGDSRQISLQ